ncbi:MAG: hypothetical protein A2519_04310 [Candidatus Raymondbacteria bacterium RIFOXYD12_FULL_49_13]|nr:MAG: hypothetical protein A2519_04310 [Candidatus Raymondbacteria bacterium RIFOXYD12_FULL_49_13]
MVFTNKGGSMADIYQYSDYRAFLRDWFKEQKSSKPNFSHQYLASKAGIGSSGFVLHVMKGERNLTKSVLLKIARAMGLSANQTDYFEDLVSFCQAKTQSEKDFYFSKIAAARKSLSVKNLDDQQYEFYSRWYNSVLREIITIVKDSRPEALAKLLIPKIAPSEAKKGFRVMEKLGIIKKEKGGYAQTEAFIEGGGPVRNIAVINYQKEMLRVALEAWDRFKETEISASTLTLCMSEELVEKIKEETREFKKRLFQIVADEQKAPERVYHININFFPVSKAVKEGREV